MKVEIFVAERYHCPKCNTPCFSSLPTITTIDDAGKSHYFLKFPSQVHCSECQKWFDADKELIDPNLLAYEFICDECGRQNFDAELPMPHEAICRHCEKIYEVSFPKLALCYWLKSKNLNGFV